MTRRGRPAATSGPTSTPPAAERPGWRVVPPPDVVSSAVREARPRARATWPPGTPRRGRWPPRGLTPPAAPRRVDRRCAGQWEERREGGGRRRTGCRRPLHRGRGAAVRGDPAGSAGAAGAVRGPAAVDRPRCSARVARRRRGVGSRRASRRGRKGSRTAAPGPREGAAAPEITVHPELRSCDELVPRSASPPCPQTSRPPFGSPGPAPHARGPPAVDRRRGERLTPSLGWEW